MSGYVKYDSSNSGGRWWLKDGDWFALEKAGWIVSWEKDGRFLGALARSAKREGMKLRDAVDEWEEVTGKSSTSSGCPCCGQPHYFTEYDENDKEVASGPYTSYECGW